MAEVVHPSHSVSTLSVLRISTLPRSRERIPTCWQCSSAMPIRCCRLCTNLAHSKRLLPRNPITSFPSSSIICSPVMYIARSVFWLASTHVAQYRGQTFARGCKVPIAPQRCSVMSNERKYKNVVLSPIARGTSCPGHVLVPWAHSPIWSRQDPIFVSLTQIASYKR